MNKKGVGVGVICKKRVPLKWMIHQNKVTQHFPGGLTWTYIYDTTPFNEEYSYAEARTKIVNKALERNFEYLFFIDTDVFLPVTDALTQLMRHEENIVTGVYWMKCNPPQPVVYKEFGSGPIWNINPSKGLVEIGGAGLGCCLIKTSVFEKFQKEDIPFFKEDFTLEENGKKIKTIHGEDHWFFKKAKELGFQPYCDMTILCDHYDVENDRFFPGDEVVEEITTEYLENEGRGDLVKECMSGKNLEKHKPTIVFFNASKTRFNGDSIKQGPLGGSETDLINIAREIKKLGWNVHVFCNTDKPGVYDGVSYSHFSKLEEGLERVSKRIGRAPDVFVSSRNVLPFKEAKLGRVTVFWPHDMPGEYAHLLNDYINNIDYVFFISDFQKECFLEEASVPKSKIYVTRNAVDLNRFDVEGVERQRGKCIYTCTPFRGLDVLLDVWPRIKKRVPYAELHVYSGMSLYGMSNSSKINELLEYAKSLRGKDVFVNEPVDQYTLAKVMLSADVMLYPCHFPETFCVSALESIVAGAPVVTSDFGALGETVGDDEGVLVNGSPRSKSYQDAFVDAAVRLLSDDDYRSGFCKNSVGGSGWGSVAMEWNKVFKKRFNSGSYWDRKHERLVKGDGGDGVERFRFVMDLVPEGSSVLDFGSARGGLLGLLSDSGDYGGLFGLDISEFAVDYCEENVSGARFSTVSDGFDARVDVVTCLHTLEHVAEPEEKIKELKRKYLKNNGLMIISLPLMDDPYVEHVKVWSIGDVEALATSVAEDYTVYNRSRVYDDGRKSRGRESVVVLKF